MNILNQSGMSGNTLLVISKDDLERAFEDAMTSFMEKMATEMKAKKDDEVLLTENEVQQLLNVTHATLWRWNCKGILHNVKIGRKVMWRQSDINRMLHKQ